MTTYAMVGEELNVRGAYEDWTFATVLRMVELLFRYVWRMSIKFP